MRSNKELIEINKTLAISGKKCCILCRETKTFDNFFCRKVYKLGGYSPRCKSCHPERKELLKGYNIKRKEEKDTWRKDNLDKMNLSKRKWKLNKYNVTIDQYELQRAIQKDCCAICNTSVEDLPRRLCIDHCHTTMKFRGLLCDRCNRVLGQFEDSVELLQSAINYINTSKIQK